MGKNNDFIHKIGEVPDEHRKKGMLEKMVSAARKLPGREQPVKIEDPSIVEGLSREIMDMLRMMMSSTELEGGILREIAQEYWPEEAAQIDREFLQAGDPLPPSKFAGDFDGNKNTGDLGLDNSSFLDLGTPGQSESGQMAGKPGREAGKPHPHYLPNPTKR